MNHVVITVNHGRLIDAHHSRSFN